VNDVKRLILFHRNYWSFQGGHLKVWNYFTHALDSGIYFPMIRFSDSSVWDESNPWSAVRNLVVGQSDTIAPDALFIAGLDWRMIEPDKRHPSPVPVINFIQHVRHSDPGEELYSFLSYKAVRICVSEEVASAIRSTGRANGPVFAIPNGIDVQGLDLSQRAAHYRSDVLIAGLKNPAMALRLAKRLEASGRRIICLSSPLPRATYLRNVAEARVAVFLPHRVEGCYLPPIEGMGLGTIVVCPEGIGTSYCRAGYNCFRPEYREAAILSAVNAALRLSEAEAGEMRAHGRETLQIHDIVKEKESFLKILDNLDYLWRHHN
jgi:hypothetical protein